MSLAQALLVAGSALPLVGQLCEACRGILGSAGEFSEKADDVLVAAERVIDVLRTVHLMAKNVDRLEDGRDLAESTICLLYTSPSPRDQRGSRMPSSA